MNKKLKVILISIFLVVLIVRLLFYDSIIYPAYMSTKIGCTYSSYDEMPKEIQEQIAGSFSIKEGRVIINNYANSSRTEKHELCHLKQYEEGRLFYCQLFGILKLWNEIECEIKERM